MLVFTHPAGAFEIGFNKGKENTSISIDRQYIKGELFSEHRDAIRAWSDIELSWEVGRTVLSDEGLTWTDIAHLKVVLYPVLDYSLNDHKTKEIFRKAYAAMQMKNTYVAIGKQPIIWGVGKGTNPTNYLMQLNTFDKQREPEIPLEGVDSMLIEFPVKDITVETVFASPKSIKNATRFKAFAWDTDLSISFFTAEDEKKIGGDFERDFHGLFGLYGEYAAGNVRDNYQYVAGVSKVIPFFTRASVNLEHQRGDIKERKENVSTLQLFLSPREEVSLLSITSYDWDKAVTLSMIRIGYSIGRGEFAVVGTFKPNGKEGVDSFPFEYTIQSKFIYYYS